MVSSGTRLGSSTNCDHSCICFADDPQTADQYHQEYNPPVEGSYTGMNKQEKVVPVTDRSNDREQVQQRLVRHSAKYHCISISYFCRSCENAFDLLSILI